MMKVGITGSLASGKQQLVKFYQQAEDPFLALMQSLKNYIQKIILKRLLLRILI